MGSEGVNIGRTIAGAGMTAAGAVSGNPQLAFFGASNFFGGLSSLLFDPDTNRDPFTFESDPERWLPVVYGRSTVSGSFVDARMLANDDETLWVVPVFCQGGTKGPGGTPDGSVNQIRFILDGDRVDSTGSREIIVDSTGSIQGDYSDGVATVNQHTGSYSQTVDSDLSNTFTAWDSDNAGAGIVYAAMELKWDEDVWDGPPNIMAQIDGNVVYDPRDGNWKWSSNPALCILDFLASNVYGMGANYPERDSDGTVSEVNEQSFIDMANYCDEDVTINYSDGTSTTRTRFECNGIVDTSEKPINNLEQLLTSCRGDMVYQGGEFRLHIPRDKTSVSFSLDEDNIVGDWVWRRGGFDEVPNEVKCEYVPDIQSPESRESIVWPEPGNTNVYLSNDNGYKNRKDIDLPFSTSQGGSTEDLVKSILMVGLKEARQDLVVDVTVRESALQLEIGDIVPVTHETPGWTDKNFWVRSMVYQPEEHLVRLRLSEFDAAAYSLDTADKASGPPGSNIPGTRTVDPPTNLTITTDDTTAVGTPGGTQFPAARWNWDEPSNKKFLDHYQLQYKKSSSTNWSDVTNVQRGTSEHLGPVLRYSVSYDYRIRSINVAGYKSSWVSVTNDDALGGGSKTPSGQIIFEPGSSDSTQIAYNFDGSPGENGGTRSDLEGRWQKDDDANIQEADFTAWQSGTPYFGSGDPSVTYTSWSDTDMIVLEVRDTSIGSAPYPKTREFVPVGDSTNITDTGPGFTISTSAPPSSTDEPDGYVWFEVD